MAGLRPTITARINDTDARFLLDSGAFYSMISSATAAQFGLRLRSAPNGLRVVGIGGSAEARIATVKTFTLAGIPLHNVEFLVGGSEVGSDAVGLLGQNFLEKWDVEYDFAKGVVRLMKAEDCKHALLAYWVTPGQPLSMMDISFTTPLRPHTTGTAFINGTKISVMFDTGAWTSMLSLKAAARAGVKPDTPGVIEIGHATGIGRGSVKTYSAPFASFKIGDDEEIKNTRLRIADINIDEGDMLLGADFFASHHVFVANSQHRVYFTYNGGPVFNLTSAPAADADAKPDESSDAAALALRGAASAARQDFEHALSDLSRACELEPDNPEYSYQRGMAYWGHKEPVPAMKDFDRALEINPDYLPARLSRAQLRVGNKDLAGAADDLDAADRIAPKQADVRYTMAQLYRRANRLDLALAQYDHWIDNHPDDSKMIEALNGRCWIRALQGRDLAKALADCNAALSLSVKRSPIAARILDGRGLVRLRMGDFDRAIADYDESLKLEPKAAWPLYGRGIAKIRKKNVAQGQADVAQAVSLAPAVADEFTQRGITP